MARAEILIAGEPVDSHSVLVQRLVRWGARCNFATSCDEVCRLLGKRTFDVVICAATLADGSALRAVPLLAGSQTTLFCSLPVEDSCLWIRIVEKGCVCERPFVWRPSEFGHVLRQALEDKTRSSCPGIPAEKDQNWPQKLRPVKLVAKQRDQTARSATNSNELIADRSGSGK